MKTRIRELGRTLENRGADTPPPGNLEASATGSNYTNYLTKEQFEQLGSRPDPRRVPYATGW